MPSEQFIFVGFRLEAELAERFATCGESVRVFLTDPIYLETLKLGDGELVGKRIEAGAPGDRLEDTVRSVISVIARVAPGFALEPGDARIVALEERRAPDQPPET
jgi:hypothetical protein